MKTFICNILLAGIAILAPLQASVLAMGFLIFSDLFMGLISAYKNGEKITSKKLKNTGVKMLIYNMLLLVGFVTEMYLVTFIPFTKLCLVFLAVVEFKSIAENFQKISGLPFLKYVNKFINEKLNPNESK